MTLPPLQEPWFRPDAEQAAALLAEARGEISPGHELANVDQVECTAKCAGCDDAVFMCADGSFAVIHLSWREDEQPPWPECTRAGSFLAIELVMDQHEH